MSDQADQTSQADPVDSVDPVDRIDMDPGTVAEATQLSVLPTPRPERTGVPEVDAALDRLDEIEPTSGDLDRHVAAFEEVHVRLQEALGTTDSD